MTQSNPAPDWGTGRRGAARDRILTVAGEVFAQRGPDVSMSDIAAAVGCSRATLYRHFPNRTRLHLDYVELVARDIARSVARQTADVADPVDRLTASMVAALALVRADPALAAWFAPDGAGTASGLALSSQLIEEAAAGVVGGADDESARGRAARWVIRVIVSFLAVPGRSTADERATIATLVSPAVIASSSKGRA